jgi:hypothetical protein
MSLEQLIAERTAQATRAMLGNISIGQQGSHAECSLVGLSGKTYIWPANTTTTERELSNHLAKITIAELRIFADNLERELSERGA